MAIAPKKLQENLQRIRENIAAACAKARRDPSAVTLVAVTKTADLDDIKNLIELGVGELGEGRVQQLTERQGQLQEWLSRRRKETSAVRWHMIGHLQRNKVKQVLQSAQVIHSIDSLRLAEEIDARAAALNVVPDVMLEVNCSQEEQKFGVAVGASMHLAEQMATLKNLRVVGLMAMAPLSEDPEAARPTFVRMRELFEDMLAERIGGKTFRHLSMGMSQDYGVAIEEGATMIRVGRALFGEGQA